MASNDNRGHHPGARGVGFLLLAVLALIAIPAVASAQEHDAEHHTDVDAEAHEHGEHHGHHYHLNEIAVFGGVINEEGHSAQITLGFEYERRLSQRWGVGGLLDWAGGDHRNMIFGIPVYLHLGGHFKLLAAPGIEIHKGRDDSSHDEHESEGDETNFLVRVGAAYDFHITEHWGLAPNVNIDFVDGETVWVYV